MIISPSLDSCIQDYTCSRAGSSRSNGGDNDGSVGLWEVIYKVKVGGKIFLHVLVPTINGTKE
eukprot:COSAG02_NODE_7867_length_2811_cov_6.892440_3_plen_63_part_00